MNLQMNADIAKEYVSNSQKVRVITESWVADNLYCPFCGNLKIRHYENNRPVADFYCPYCSEQYELKSKNGAIGNHIADGAYDTMIQRINSDNNPNFFFLHYNKTDLKVKDFVMIPKYFFVPDIIEKRKPLSERAQRAGWIGCNIRLNQIPADGRIPIVKDEKMQPIDKVISQVKRTKFISQYNLAARGWVMDVLVCVDKIDGNDFTLEQMYQFEGVLSVKHPENHHVRDKIRQQLQILRDRGLIEFCGNGHYRKIHDT